MAMVAKGARTDLRVPAGPLWDEGGSRVMFRATPSFLPSTQGPQEKVGSLKVNQEQLLLLWLHMSVAATSAASCWVSGFSLFFWKILADKTQKIQVFGYKNWNVAAFKGNVRLLFLESSSDEGLIEGRNSHLLLDLH